MHPGKRLSTLLSALFCLTALATTFAGCGGSTSTSTTTKPTKAPAGKQVYRYPLETPDIASFDPGQATDLYSIPAIQMVFTGLVQLDDSLKVQPQLAQSYDASSDGLSYTFHLRSNLKFSDGAPLTSQDVIYSIDRALSPQISNLNGVSLTYLGLIKDSAGRTTGKVKSLINDSLMAPDPNTVIIKLNKATGYFLEALTYPAAFVVEKSVIDRWGLRWVDHLNDNGGQGGDGPFKVTKYDHNIGIDFVPNADYYGPHPQLQHVRFLFFKDRKTSYSAYEASQVDSTNIPTSNYDQAKNSTKEFHKVPSLWINYYSMNYLVKPFDNIKIRQAFALAIDKDAITRAIWHDQYVATNHIVPQGMPGYNPNLTGPDGEKKTSGNEAMAKQLFTQGLQEEGLTLANFPTINFAYSNSQQEIANEVTTVIGMWQRVLGVTSIKPEALAFNELLKQIVNTTNTTSLTLWRVDWIADYPDPQDWLTLQFDKNAPNNNMNYGQNKSTNADKQQATQQQMEKADATLTQATRFQIYNQAEQQLVNDVAWIPVQQVTVTSLLKPNVVGVINNAVSLTPPNDWANIYISQ